MPVLFAKKLRLITMPHKIRADRFLTKNRSDKILILTIENQYVM